MRLPFEEGADFSLRAAEKKFDEVVVHASRSNARQIKFTNNELSTGRTWANQTISLFVAKGKRVASTSIKELDKDVINKTVLKLEKFVKKSEPNTEFEGLATGRFAYREVQNLYDPRVAALTADELVSLVKAGIDGANSKGAQRASGVLET
jgi:predicted Zn-dependent protease